MVNVDVCVVLWGWMTAGPFRTETSVNSIRIIQMLILHHDIIIALKDMTKWKIIQFDLSRLVQIDCTYKFEEKKKPTYICSIKSICWIHHRGRSLNPIPWMYNFMVLNNICCVQNMDNDKGNQTLCFNACILFLCSSRKRKQHTESRNELPEGEIKQ